ncbi:hypothetical protein [Tenacibaculum sp.]|uniref:hypothetical protein n=1 Tax=Tenacibaculum sp. TaxID=1906242 RepID=UPI003D0CC0E8
MKLKILVGLITLFAFTQVSLAQKVKIKKGIALVDGKEYVKVEKESGNMSVYGLNSGDEIIFMKYIDPTPQNKQNHDSYYIVRFIDFDSEVEISRKTRKGILKMLYKGKVINGDSIDKAKMKSFISKYGSDESKNKLYIR